MARKITVSQTDAGKFQALDSTNQPIVEADTQEEISAFFEESAPGEIELELPKSAGEGKKEDSEKAAETGEKDTGTTGHEQTAESGDEEKEGTTVPLAALKAERSKRQSLEGALSDVAALRQELAQIRTLMQKPQEDADTTLDDAPVTKKDLLQYFGEMEKRQKASQADSVLKELAGMEKPEGFMLEPKQIIELTGQFLKSDVEARRLLVEAEDRTSALKDLERIALMTIALRDPSSFPKITTTHITEKPVVKGNSKVAASVAATKKIDALAAGSKIHDALSQAGDGGGGDLTSPTAGHIAKLQSFSGNPAAYAAYWSKLPADIRKQIDEELE